MDLFEKIKSDLPITIADVMDKKEVKHLGSTFAYGDTFRPKYCGLPGSELRCKDCWERKYRAAKKAQSSFTAEDISEPALIAGRYTLAELIVPNGKAVRA